MLLRNSRSILRICSICVLISVANFKYGKVSHHLVYWRCVFPLEDLHKCQRCYLKALSSPSDLWVCLYRSHHKSLLPGHFCSAIYWPKTICVKNVLRSCQICTREYLRKTCSAWERGGSYYQEKKPKTNNTFWHNILVPCFMKRRSRSLCASAD